VTCRPPVPQGSSTPALRAILLIWGWMFSGVFWCPFRPGLGVSTNPFSLPSFSQGGQRRKCSLCHLRNFFQQEDLFVPGWRFWGPLSPRIKPPVSVHPQVRSLFPSSVLDQGLLLSPPPLPLLLASPPLFFRSLEVTRMVPHYRSAAAGFSVM